MTEPARTLPCPQCAQVGLLEYSEGHYGIMKIPPMSSWILEFFRCTACIHLWTNFISLEPDVSKEDCIAWISDLNESIWRETPRAYVWGTSRPYVLREAARRVKETEWQQLLGVIQTANLFCEMSNANMGFGFGMRVYKSPDYPGLPLEVLLYVTTDHFDDRTRTRPDGYDREWSRFEKVVYAPKNIESLVFHGLGKPRDKAYYDY